MFESAYCVQRPSISILATSSNPHSTCLSVTACAEELSSLGGGRVVPFVGDVALKQGPSPTPPSHTRACCCCNYCHPRLIASTADCERMAAAAIAALGGITVLCCNAGIMPASKLCDMQESEIDSILGTNIKGTIFAVQACTAALAASGHGRLGLLHPTPTLFPSPIAS